MKCALLCKYKGVKHIQAGSFIIDGVEKSYKESYKLIFDQIFNDIPKECSLKIKKELALNISANCKPYDNIVINLDIDIYDNSNIRLNVVSIEKKN